MKWLKKKVIKWVREDWEDVRTASIRSSFEVEATVCDDDPILNFRVFSAVGGSVIEFRRYDRKTDRSDTTTYIINKDEDFGEKISKIANLEMLK